jgi:hypothetical protein
MLGNATRVVKSKRLIFISVATLALIAAAAYCSRQFGGWDTITVPLDSEFSLRVSRKTTHPFLAEYD